MEYEYLYNCVQENAYQDDAHETSDDYLGCPDFLLGKDPALFLEVLTNFHAGVVTVLTTRHFLELLQRFIGFGTFIRGKFVQGTKTAWGFPAEFFQKFLSFAP